MIRAIRAVFAFVLLAGCATSMSAEMTARLEQLGATATPPASRSGMIAITDRRDPEATRVRYTPLGIAGGFSCNIGILRLGDTLYAPDRIARLENAIAAAFPNRLEGATLVVRRYDIHLNHSAESNAQNVSAAMGGGLLTAAIAPTPSAGAPTRAPRCERDRMLAGWYETSDLTNNFPPIVVEIDATVFGQDIAINSATSPEVNLFGLAIMNPSHMEGAPLRAAVEASVQRAQERANARFIERLAAATPAVE